MANDEKLTLLERLRKLLSGPSAPEPTPDIKPDTPPNYLKVWLALRDIPMQKLGPLLFTVPVVVFLAISEIGRAHV